MKDLNSSEIEFLSEIASRITEINFGLDSFTDDYKTTYSEEAQDYFNSEYEEAEGLYRKLILNE